MYQVLTFEAQQILERGVSFFYLYVKIQQKNVPDGLEVQRDEIEYEVLF